MGLDDRLAKYPGSVATKAFLASLVVSGVVATSAYKYSTRKQGHDYFSSDKPEVIRAGQEELRKQYRHNRDNPNKENQPEEQK